MWAYTNEESDYLSFFGDPPARPFLVTRPGRPVSGRSFRFSQLLPDWLTAWLSREAEVQELYGLEPRMLADLGINRGDFPAILAGTYARDPTPPAPRGELASRALAMPADANPSGVVFGGWVMALMDAAGAMTATRAADGRVVTVSVSNITFLQPLRVGDSVCCYADVARAGKTSLTLGVEVWVLREGRGERTKVTHAEFTFVAVDDAGKPRTLPRRTEPGRFSRVPVAA